MKDIEDAATAESQTSASNKEAEVETENTDWAPEEESRLVRKSVAPRPMSHVPGRRVARARALTSQPCQTRLGHPASSGARVLRPPARQRQHVSYVKHTACSRLPASSMLTGLNSGSAYTDLFTFDVGITQNQYNTGNTLMSVGIVILEIPSNLVLYKVGPRLWLGGQVLAW